MNNHQRWQQPAQQYNQGYHQNYHPQEDANHYSRAATDSVQQAQGLLAVYPMASANPTNHVARHLSAMSLTAEPPTFTQPSYYSPQNQRYQGYTQGNSPPPYTEYAQELAYMNSHNQSVTQSTYWNNTRDNAVQMLNTTNGPAYSYQTPQHWASQPVQQSSYTTPPFAQSLFQRTTPQAAYPTPPPPSMSLSSSSLAYALGPPQPPQPPKVYKPEESPAYFDSFMEQKTREMNASRPPVAPPTPMTPQKSVNIPPPPRPKAQESPDPLSIQSTSSLPPVPAVVPPPVVPSVATPSRKRKVFVQLESPAVKRIQSAQNLKPPRPDTFPQTPKHQRDHKPKTPGSQRMAYVAVPPKPWLTPRQQEDDPTAKSSKALGKMKIDDLVEDEDDLGGFGEDDSPMKVDMVKHSARRTGDRDERTPLEKFISLVEDIFDAEDSLPADVDLNDLPTEYFSQTTTVDASRPVLHPNVVQKLIKVIGNVTRPTKRLRAVTGAQATPRVRSRMADVDTQMLSRLLKTLDRSVKAGEDIDPFPRNASSDQSLAAANAMRAETASPSKKSPTKKAARKKGSTPQEGDDLADSQENGLPAEFSDADHDKLARALEIGRDSVVAADCCIALLISDRLTKQLYSEELITSCLSSIKNQLTKIIYPFVEAYTELSAGASGSNLNPALHYLITNNSPTCQSNRRQLSEIFQALSSVIPRVNTMVNTESVAMSDAIIIQAVYIAIGPFFVVEGTGAEADGTSRGKKSTANDNVILRTFGKSAMRGLRMDALALIRSIFANHEDQRSWIIEEILSSLIKLSDTKQKAGQFRLRDGRSIRTVSALLLQLVQTSAHDVRVAARKIDKARQNKFALKRQESLTESQLQNAANEPFLDEIDLEEIQLYGSGLESATKAAKTIVLFLTQRSGKGKATKNSNEAEYRTIFDNLIADLLVVLFWPEWPAASLLLSVACKYMVSSLDDVRTNQTDSNAAKSIALDHLGVIAARIRSSTLNVQSNADKYQGVKPMDEIVAASNVKEFKKLVKTHRDIAAHLCKRSSEDQAYDSAREFTAATFGHELAAGLRQVDAWINDPDADDDLNIKDTSKLDMFGRMFKETLQSVWKDPSADVFDIGSQEEVTRIDRLGEEIGTIQSLRNSFTPILTVILVALDAPAIFMRTKALKALGQIITSDATILGAPNVRRSIESHLLDSSPAVRDAAVELIGKYMVDSPEVAGGYFQKIADRIADTGLGVRKRVIKLLKSYYGVIEDNDRRVDISTRIVHRMLDEDETVRDLAVKTMEELWFPSNTTPFSAKPPSSNSSIAKGIEKTALMNKVAVIMGTAAAFKDRQSALEDLLHKIMAEKSGHDATLLHARYAEICEALIDGLVDASELPGFTVINCIRTIHLFTSAHPTILSGSRASTLLPYLKNDSSPEDQSTSDYLLKIFRISVPHMPKTAAKFGQELQLALQPMVLKPSGGALQILQEAVACMCIVIQNLTHDFTRLVNLLKSCNARLQQALKRPTNQDLQITEVRALSVLAFIVSLLGQNCDFDQVRREQTKLAQDIDTISQGSIIEHIYSSVLSLYNKYENASLRARLLQCLGFLFRAQPTLMTMEKSSKIMDDIFSSPGEEARGRLLKILQEFLVSESLKHSAKEKELGKAKPKAAGVNMEELVGNTDGFADSGVSSAVVQRYLNQILEAALSLQPSIQATAIDVLTFTIKQGLAHPLQSFPVIVALETSPVPTVCNRASALHTILNNKHASLLNARYTISAKASFDYQKKISNGPFNGYRMQNVPVALLQRWYSHVREKRQTRQDFLKSLVKVFQESPNQKASQDDVDFIRYMAENFSAFDYKTHEEVITVIKHLTTVLSTTGVQLLETLSPSHLLSHLQTSAPQLPTDAMDVVSEVPANATTDLTNHIPLMRSSVIISMVMLLKSYLKNLYSLSEDKCNKFILGKKSATGDKPTSRRHDKPIDWQRLSFATAPILTSEDVATQKRTFLDIWNEDGVSWKNRRTNLCECNAPSFPYLRSSMLEMPGLL